MAWVVISIVAGTLISRCEFFDEEDLDTALARFDELPTQTLRLENAASRLSQNLLSRFTAGDLASGRVRAWMADDFVSDDRRRVISTGVIVGRDAIEATLRAGMDVGYDNATSTVVATAGIAS